VLLMRLSCIGDLRSGWRTYSSACVRCPLCSTCCLKPVRSGCESPSPECTSRGTLPQEVGGTVLISLPLTRWGRCGRLGARWNACQPSRIVIVRYVRLVRPTRSDEGCDGLGNPEEG
jgi:hypothetical protein